MESFLKFLVVGTIGFIINTVVLVGGVKFGLKPSFSGPLGAEFAILSNFVLNNFWTFSNKTMTSWDVIPGKFIQFNLLSFGSVVIQFVFLKVGELLFGLEEFKKPILNSPFFKRLFFLKYLDFAKPLTNKFTAYMVFYMAGVGVGLVWNYIMYSQIIWR